MTTNVHLNFPISTTKAGEDLAAASTTASAWSASLSYKIKINKNLGKTNEKNYTKLRHLLSFIFG